MEREKEGINPKLIKNLIHQNEIATAIEQGYK
jgi:hypothetical protein